MHSNLYTLILFSPCYPCLTKGFIQTIVNFRDQYLDIDSFEIDNLARINNFELGNLVGNRQYEN